MAEKIVVAPGSEWPKLICSGLGDEVLQEDAFNAKNQEFVTGEVKMKTFEGAAKTGGRTSPHSLYRTGLATYASTTFNQEWSKGFIEISTIVVVNSRRREGFVERIHELKGKSPAQTRKTK